MKIKNLSKGLNYVKTTFGADITWKQWLLICQAFPIIKDRFNTICSD